MDGSLAQQYLHNYLEKTDLLFEDYLSQKISDAQEISKIPAELLKRFKDTARKGKKIRGSLVVLGYVIGEGTDMDAIYDTSLFIELFHAGALVHDDIMDRDDQRRGLPTLHKQFAEIAETLHVSDHPNHFGESMAINIGSAAFYQSWEKLLNSTLPEDRILETGKLYTYYVLRVMSGQVLDITNTNLHNITERDILEVLRLKTGEYTGSFPLLAGYTLATQPQQSVSTAIKEYGLHLGWAFQIQDDILGTFGDEQKTGKPVGSDIREGKTTLLMLHLQNHGTTEQKQFQRNILGKETLSEDEISQMQTILKECGAYDAVIQKGWEHIEIGKTLIPTITDNKHLQDILESLLVFMMERAQ